MTSFLLFGLLFNHFQPEFALELNNIQDASGSVYIAIYNKSDDFLKYDHIYSRKIVPVSQTGTMRVSIHDLPPGAYAVSCFHDVNGNGQLDTDWMGIPTEPYCFSNNARPKFRAPRWSEAVFQFPGEGLNMRLKMEKW
ncbi:MAG: DUF2141 domain-containing protein [Saprospiraceae bacterium]|nr:DUF2141 domain-containing protein [Saprospiraceae bacterium]